MSSITISGSVSGTGTFTITSPNSNTNRTLTLPDAAGEVVVNTAAQTLTNKSIDNSTINGGTITLGTAVASTSGSNIDFTGIPSWAKRITVSFSNVSTTGTVVPLLQLGTSGGIQASGYLGASSVFGTGVASVNYTTGFGYVGNTTNQTAATVFHGHIVVTLLSGNTWVASGVQGRSSGTLTGITAGSVTLSGTLDRVRITCAADSFDAGTINVMWEG